MKKTILGFVMAMSIVDTGFAHAAATNACIDLKNNLQYKSSGTEVSLLQNYLQKNGFMTENATGFFGSATKAGVIKFQKSNQISAIGLVGPASRTKIKNMSCGAQSASVATSTIIKAPVVPTVAAAQQAQNTSGSPVYVMDITGKPTDPTLQRITLEVKVADKNGFEINPGTFITNFTIKEADVTIASIPVNSTSFTLTGGIYYVQISSLNFQIPKDSKRTLTVYANTQNTSDSRFVAVSIRDPYALRGELSGQSVYSNSLINAKTEFKNGVGQSVPWSAAIGFSGVTSIPPTPVESVATTPVAWTPVVPVDTSAPAIQAVWNDGSWNTDSNEIYSGEKMYIVGTNFIAYPLTWGASAVTIFLDNVPLNPVVPFYADPNQRPNVVHIVVPKDKPEGVYPVYIKTSAGKTSNVFTASVKKRPLLANPILSSLSQTSGQAGDLVTITGENFRAGGKVNVIYNGPAIQAPVGGAYTVGDEYGAEYVSPTEMRFSLNSAAFTSLTSGKYKLSVSYPWYVSNEIEFTINNPLKPAL